MMKPFKVGYTTGVFDLFHIGHLNILRRAKEQCGFLIVGVSTDDLVEKEKNKHPVIPFEERIAIVKAIRYVDAVVPQISKDKLEAYKMLRFNAMFVGDDWKGTQQWNIYEKQLKPYGVKIVYFSRTEHTSSTLIAQYISQNLCKNEQ